MLDLAARRLLWVNGLFALANGMSGLFTNVYLWRLRPGVATLAQYNLWMMLAVLVTIPSLGALVKRRGAAVICVLGNGLYALFYLGLLLLQEQAAWHLAALGIFMGVALSANALAGHVLVYDLTRDDHRDLYYNRNGLNASLAGLLAPLVAGWLVASIPGLAGYRIIFVLSFLLFGASTWLALRLGARRPPAPYRLWQALSAPHRGWRRLLLSYAVVGLRDGIFSFAVTLLVYLAASHGEAGLGNFTFLTSGVGLAAYWVAARLMTPANRGRFWIWGALVMAAANGVLGFGVSFPLMLTYGLLIAVATPLWSTAFSAVAFATIKEASGEQDLRIEMICAREIPLNLGRVITLAVFLWLVPPGAAGNTGLLQLLVPFLGLVFPLAWLIARGKPAASPANVQG